jgi:hypothetical protein
MQVKDLNEQTQMLQNPNKSMHKKFLVKMVHKNRDTKVILL